MGIRKEDYEILLENVSKNRGRNGIQHSLDNESKGVLSRLKEPGGVLAVASQKEKHRQPSSCAMNRWESRYADYLRTLQAAGEVKWFGFEAVKLRLAKATYYTPDFLVVPSSGPWELHEVKGFWRDDARVKIKVAAEHFPFVFVAVRLSDGRWIQERF